MFHRSRGVLIGALAMCCLAPASGQAAEIPGSYIVTLKSGDPASAADDARRGQGAEVAHVYRHALSGYSARMSERAAAAIARQDRVASVVPDQTVSIAAQSLPTGIDRIDGELSSTVSGNGSGAVSVDVAVIDTGVDLDHPDLNVVGGTNCSNGRSYDDGNGHGTHVAGTIGAKDDANGVVGVAPGARVWAVRVLNNQGSGSWSSIICGLDWVTANAGTIEVANMSLGGTGSDTGCNDGGMHQAICRSVGAGVTYAVAAGNESDDAARHVPAAYDEVITVSALADFNGKPGGGAAPTCRADVDDTFADFSNFGADVDLIAPGVCILSTWKGGGYNTISGTSMASPHVAGAAALYKAGSPGASPAQVKSALQSAGTLDWNDVDDPDPIKERLLNVDAF
ncbi:MAG TPA: S8 family peptidase [Solirubrobacteraceae bacterium]|nr:S8 family peptidase [Solirubrobacteraceae bacterium]